MSNSSSCVLVREERCECEAVGSFERVIDVVRMIMLQRTCKSAIVSAKRVEEKMQDDHTYTAS